MRQIFQQLRILQLLAQSCVEFHIFRSIVRKIYLVYLYILMLDLTFLDMRRILHLMRDKRKTLHKFILLIYYLFLFHYLNHPYILAFTLAEDILPLQPPLSLLNSSKLGLIVKIKIMADHLNIQIQYVLILLHLFHLNMQMAAIEEKEDFVLLQADYVDVFLQR